jgi:hypothetical protein
MYIFWRGFVATVELLFVGVVMFEGLIESKQTHKAKKTIKTKTCIEAQLNKFQNEMVLQSN